MKFSSIATALVAAISSVSVLAQDGTVDAAQQQPSDAAVGLSLNKFTPLGCYPNPGAMWDMGAYTYQTTGWCQPLCVRQSASYFALVNGTNCFCGNDMPDTTKKVSSTQCNKACNGFDAATCGGVNHWAIFESGFRSGDPTGAIHITTPIQTWFGHSATSKPSTMKTVTGGQTVIITAAAATSSSDQSSGGGGPNKAAIAAGVVVGILCLGAIIGASILYMRSKKRKEQEEERRRHESIMRIVNPASEKPPSYAGSDQRLEPAVMFQRRQSDGSIMDNQDYSRRILKVTNPDFRNSGFR